MGPKRTGSRRAEVLRSRPPAGAGYAAAKALRSCSSCSVLSEVFNTVPPNFRISGSTLSGVTLRISTNSADVPGWMFAPNDLMKSSSMP